MSWFAGTRRDKESHGRGRSGREVLGDLAVEAGGVIAIALALLGIVAETTTVRAVVLSVAGLCLAVVVVAMWRRWRPAVEGWVAGGVVLACLAAATFAYLTEIR